MRCTVLGGGDHGHTLQELLHGENTSDGGLEAPAGVEALDGSDGGVWQRHGVCARLDPGVLEGLGGGDALGGVEGEEAADEVLGLVGNVSPVLFLEGVVAVADLVVDGVVILSIERWVSAQQDVHDDADSPRIHLQSVAFVCVEGEQHLGRQIAGRSDCALQALLGRDHDGGEAKVGDEHLGVGVLFGGE